jgi:membrane-associated phospholipid phosphatase
VLNVADREATVMNDTERSRVFLLAITLSSYALVLLLAWVSKLGISMADTSILVLYFALFTGCVSILATRWQMHQLRNLTECVGCGFLLVVPITISTYLAIQQNLPLADEQLAFWDRAIGVDWIALMRWVDAHALVAWIFNKAYRTFSYQLLAWPIVLILCKRSVRAYQMVSAYGLLCFAASAISIWWPAVGTYSYYQFDANTLENIDQTYGYHFLTQFHRVRDEPGFVWSLKESAGILTFPSVHAAVATLCAWAMWDIRLLRYPVFMLNVAMGASAVPSANHYVIDVIAGCLVALLVVALVVVMTRGGQRHAVHQIPVAAER